MNLLTDREQVVIKTISDKAVATLNALNKALSFNDLSELLNSYIGIVNDNKGLLLLVIKKAFNIKRKVSVNINDLISLSDYFKACLDNAEALDELIHPLIKSFNSFLKGYGIRVIIPAVKYSLKPISTKSVVALNLDDLSEENLILEILKVNELIIKKNFLKKEDDLINSDIIKSFINEVSVDSLKNVEQRFKDFSLKVYVMLKQQVSNIQALNQRLIECVHASSAGDLEVNYALLDKEIKKNCIELKQALGVYSKATRLGFNITPVSKYVLSNLISKPEKLIKSYLIVNYEISDLISQLAYEFLVTNASINKLEDYNDFSKRAPYLIIKKLAV